MIYFTGILHSNKHITPTKETKLRHIDAITREKLPEASPKGPGYNILGRTPGNDHYAPLVYRALRPDHPNQKTKNPKQKQNIRITKTNFPNPALQCFNN